jgi:hypothetical protein
MKQEFHINTQNFSSSCLNNLQTQVFRDVTLCRLINAADVSKDIGAYIFRVKKHTQSCYCIHNLPERSENVHFVHMSIDVFRVRKSLFPYTALTD